MRAGHPTPFGATPVAGGGVNFAIHSTAATAMTLVLFRRGAPEPFAELPFPREFRTGGGYAMTVYGLDVAEVEYGYRAEGPCHPETGHRFDPSRILLDPYAKAIGGGEEWGRPRLDSGAAYPYRARIVDRPFDWEDDRPPGLPPHDLVIYEAHVRGFTRHPSSGVASPGTFAGFAEKIPHLVELGVNCVELLPVTEFDECDIQRSDPATGRRLHNYWGYHPVAFFAPKASYAEGDPVTELKELVKRLHRAGIEIVLDVVFNHTAEGDDRGPTLSLRGLGNRYYLLDADGRYRNLSGTGNTLNCNDPVVRELLLDCLRHWVTEYHVDGFRFDLATILVRAPDGTPMTNPPLLEAIAADPLLRDTKLIAEAWDADGLYQVGSFPDYGRWSEWNGRYRDTLRRFLKGDEGTAAELTDRLLGSPDLYAHRGPTASINFVTAHDGFTLWDLFSYNDKHNEANGEDNRDGEPVNHSWNCGHEGPTDDEDVLALRGRQVRNALLLLLTSHGVPMLTAGDEFGRTQSGNNNAYCQDNELAWVDWTFADLNKDLLRFTRNVIAFRRAHPALRPNRHTRADVSVPHRSDTGRLLAVRLQSGTDMVLVVANAHWEHAELDLPEPPTGLCWSRFADTSTPAQEDACEPGQERPLTDQTRLPIGPRSVVVLTTKPHEETP